MSYDLSAQFAVKHPVFNLGDLPCLRDVEAYCAHALQVLHSPLTRQAARRTGQQATRPPGALTVADQSRNEVAGQSPNQLRSMQRDR